MAESLLAQRQPGNRVPSTVWPSEHRRTLVCRPTTVGTGRASATELDSATRSELDV
jgi:hypothetical protein